jgi:hypothetical protein
MSVAAYLRALWPAASGTAVMAAAVLGLRQLTDGRLAAPLALALNAAVGVLVYAGFGLIAHRDRIDVIRRTIRESRPA